MIVEWKGWRRVAAREGIFSRHGERKCCDDPLQSRLLQGFRKERPVTQMEAMNGDKLNLPGPEVHEFSDCTEKNKK